MATGTGICPLSDRELEILAIVAEGATNAQTAQRLDISVHTVKVHLSNVYGKLGVESRTEATTLAIRNGWIRVGLDVAQVEPPAEDAVREPSWVSVVSIAVVLMLVVGVIGVPIWGVRNLGRQRGALYTDVGATAADVDRVEAQRWAVAGPLQYARSRLAVVAFKDSVLAIAGETNHGVTGVVEALNPVVQVWEPRATKPTAVSNVSAAVLDGLVYVPGGYGESGRALAVVEAYDPQMDRWASVASMPEPRFGYGLAALGGELYVFGGFDDAGPKHAVLAYDPQADRWREAGDWEQALGFVAVAVADDRAYVLGGYDGVNEHNECWAFDPNAEVPWTRIGPMSMARSGVAAVALEGRIYVIGGGWTEELIANEQYDIEKGVWEAFDSPIVGTWRAMGAALVERGTEEVIYVAGGWSGGYLAETEVFRPFYYISLPIIP